MYFRERGDQRLTDFLGIGQTQIGHDVDELLFGFGEAGVELLLLGHRRLG